MFFERASNTIFTGSYDGVICVTAADTGNSFKMSGQDKKGFSNAVHSNKVAGLTMCGGVLLSIGWDDMMRMSNADSGSVAHEISLEGQPSGIASDATLGIAVVVTNKEIALYRGITKLCALSSLSYVPTCVDILRDEEIAVGGEDMKTHIYSISGLSAITPVTEIATRSAVTSLSYAPAGDLLAIGDNGRQIEVYERGTWSGRVTGRWVAHTSRVTCLSWSPDGAYLASGSLDESLYIWNLSKPMTQLHLPYSHMGGVTGVAWLDTDRLVSCGNDHCLVTWTKLRE